MEDKDIIKALECCTKLHNCRECVLWKMHCATCVETLLLTALDLINRQNAEIDILIRKKESLRDEIVEQQAEIERLKEEKDNLIKAYKECMTEAINDFASRVEKRCIKCGIYPAFVKRQLEYVKEEMVGENK